MRYDDHMTPFYIFGAFCVGVAIGYIWGASGKGRGHKDPSFGKKLVMKIRQEK